MSWVLEKLSLNISRHESITSYYICACTEVFWVLEKFSTILSPEEIRLAKYSPGIIPDMDQLHRIIRVHSSVLGTGKIILEYPGSWRNSLLE